MENQQIFQFAESILQYITATFLYIIEYHFYKRFLGLKSKDWTFIVCVLAVVFIDSFTMKLAPKSLQIVIGNIIWLIVICSLCKGNFVIKFYASIVPNVVLLLINIAFLTFDFYVLPIAHSINNASFNIHMSISLIINTISDAIRLVALQILLRNINNILNLKEKAISLYHSLYLLIPCLSSYCFGVIFFSIQEININNTTYFLPYILPKVYYILPFVSIALLLSIFISVYTFNKMLRGEEQQQKAMLVEQQFQLKINHAKNIEGLYTGIRGIMHDINNHLTCLGNLAAINNIEEIKKYIHNIGETVSKLDLRIKTGNSISDVIINEKYNIAKAEDIKFICDFMMPNETLIEPVDLCVILSNALDNSIEACRKIKDNNIIKMISIKSYIRDMYLVIEISNTSMDKLQYKGNKIISTKLDKSKHGIGILNMEAVVKKYNGILDTIEEENKFTINILIKIR